MDLFVDLSRLVATAKRPRDSKGCVVQLNGSELALRQLLKRAEIEIISDFHHLMRAEQPVCRDYG